MIDQRGVVHTRTNATHKINPYDAGTKYERTLSDSQRNRGAHFTPRKLAQTVASALIAHVVDDRRDHAATPVGPPLVVDPSCGGGALLLAAADALVKHGFEPKMVFDSSLYGFDTDANAVETTRNALRLWGGRDEPRDTNVSCVDALTSNWALATNAAEIDAIIANPPFQNQLKGSAIRSDAIQEHLRDRFGKTIAPYVDTAAIFMLIAAQSVRPGGHVSIILPRSFMAQRDAGAIRDYLVDNGNVIDWWTPPARSFDALVETVVLTWQRTPTRVTPSGITHTRSPHICVLSGAERSPIGRVSNNELTTGSTWSPLWAEGRGIPHVTTSSTESIGTRARVTAGFRDQYYGLVGHVTEVANERNMQPGQLKLVTTSMIDPNELLWETKTVRFNKSSRLRPVVDCNGVMAEHPNLQKWIAGEQQPKIMVATQTRVIEAAVDSIGDCLPTTPVISIHPHVRTKSELYELLAAVISPPAVAWAARRFGGAAMSHAAIKLSAKQLAQIPLPVTRSAWLAAAKLLDSNDVDWEAFAMESSQSWELDNPKEVAGWWLTTQS